MPRQKTRLQERRQADRIVKECNGTEIVVFPHVYDTSGDTELMIQSVKIGSEESFLEVGCGTGAISLAVAQKVKQGIGVDINQQAVENSLENAKRLGIENVEFFLSDVFENVEGKFDVIIFNPPYSEKEVVDETDRMFWDPGNEAKEKFFQEVKEYLNPNGRIYFGWADFADIDVNLPFEYAERYGFEVVDVFKKVSKRGDYNMIVIEMIGK